jgi:hypothetical protein
MSSMQNAPGHILDPLPLMHKRCPARATIALHAIVCIRDCALIGADLVQNETITRRGKRYSTRGSAAAPPESATTNVRSALEFG